MSSWSFEILKKNGSAGKGFFDGGTGRPFPPTRGKGMVSDYIKLVQQTEWCKSEIYPSGRTVDHTYRSSWRPSVPQGCPSVLADVFAELHSSKNDHSLTTEVVRGAVAKVVHMGGWVG